MYLANVTKRVSARRCPSSSYNCPFFDIREASKFRLEKHMMAHSGEILPPTGQVATTMHAPDAEGDKQRPSSPWETRAVTCATVSVKRKEASRYRGTRAAEGRANNGLRVAVLILKVVRRPAPS